MWQITDYWWYYSELNEPSPLQYTPYKFNSNEESYSFIFHDIAGFEEKTDSGCDVEDIILALKGHMKDGYQVQSSARWCY